MSPGVYKYTQCQAISRFFIENPGRIYNTLYYNALHIVPAQKTLENFVLELVRNVARRYCAVVGSLTLYP